MRIPTLPALDPDPATRQHALQATRGQLRWAHDRPLGVATAAAVPEGQGYPASVLGEVAAATAATVSNRALRRVRRGLHRAPEQTTPTSVDALYASIDPPGLRKRMSDPATANEAFGWQRQAGPNPYSLQRLSRLPRGWPASLVRDASGSAASAMAKAGRLYLCDWRHQATLSAGAGRVLPPTQALLLAQPDGRLLPLGVRTPELVTPADGARWSLALATAQAADGNEVELFWHLGRAHFLLEAVAVAAGRQLAPWHPLAVLLQPHLVGTLAINGAARDQLVVPGGQIDVLLGPALPDAMAWVRQGVQSFDPRADRFDRALERRQLHDAPVQLPWRDDGRRVFEPLLAWVRDYVGLYYPDDAAVQADTELQGMVDALGSDDGGRLAHVGEVADREALVDLFVGVLWCATAHHAAVNYTQYDFLGDVQHAPGASWGAVPTTEPHDLDAAWASVLPPPDPATEQVDFYYQQSRIRVNTLGDYPARQFVDPRVLAPLLRLTDALAEADAAIEADDASRWWPYPYLRPSRIAASIHI